MFILISECILFMFMLAINENVNYPSGIHYHVMGYGHWTLMFAEHCQSALRQEVLFLIHLAWTFKILLKTFF